MDTPRDDGMSRPSEGLAGQGAVGGASTPGLDAAAAQAPRKPRIEVLREEPMAGADGAAGRPDRVNLGTTSQAEPYAATDGMPPPSRRSVARSGRRSGRWLLLFGALLLLTLVAALSYVAFSPGGDHTISEPTSKRGSTSGEGPGEGADGPAVDEAVETVAPTPATVESRDRDEPSAATSVPAPVAAPRSGDARSGAERRPSEDVPRDLPLATDPRDADPAGPEVPTDDDDSAEVDNGGALQTARAFYAALGTGDGAAAARYVIPSKRRSGPLSAGELTRYYSNLRRPMRLRRATSVDGDTVRVTYEYVLADGRLCQGRATVQVRQGFDGPLISGIRAQVPC